MSIFYIKRHDTSPSVEAVLTGKDGPVNLTGATVYFYMSNIISAQATIADATAGVVRYDWQTGDTTKLGYHLAEWEVIYSDGKKETFPNDGYSTVKISADLGEPS